jgi:hypothetical protein
MFSDFSGKSCRLCDNVEKYGTAGQATDDNIVRRMRFACRIVQASIHTLILSNSYSVFTVTLVTRTRIGVMLHAHCLSCFPYRINL